MSLNYEQERREFVRVKIEIPLRYKFLGKNATGPEFDTIHEGTTSNVSGGGFLLIGKIPKLEWIPDLLMQKIVVGVNLQLPTMDTAIKALTRVAWIETIDEKTLQAALGLRFRDITLQDRDKIFQFVIRCQMPS